MTALESLKRFAQPRPWVERCDFCSIAVGPVHAHLYDSKQRLMKCACVACSMLFPSSSGSHGLKQVPHRAERLYDFVLDDTLWAELQLPIDLAYFQQAKGFFPSPAGATQTTLPQSAWARLLAENPVLASFDEDVEALLVNRVGSAREYYRVSIDECFALVGLIRASWRGFTGGTEAWAEIRAFFARLGAHDA